MAAMVTMATRPLFAVELEEAFHGALD